ncbi:dihydrolipoyl dehydrogenase [Pseudomonas panipatensis]|uniref:Dihydrolipoyl dehydrogenase n=1 Tax=Pseudomonas panipatensis TaxID=428992 RepID=A0A1G8IF74_9PSED|nr:dihydrolipoyl dehydrogenase [Pseudomonas panipatensis]SDI17564.1 dihydrolipoamide dehydrogenase [Pseudomonas panipatensis]SMP74148.1 dihydrolipoamide dehydrogenase [Pseudomonas panipatensis]
MSQTLQTTLLIVGGGPGGYVAAIRAGQLGIATILVEGAALGGTCLNIGCIPSKALIHVAEEFHKAREYAGQSRLGIRVEAPSLDIARSLEWKDGIVDRLTSGVAALLKKHGVQVLQGWASIVDGKTLDVALAGGGTQRVQGEHLLLAAGSQSVELPGLPYGGKVISSTEALAPKALPKRLVVVGGGYIGLELGSAYRKLGVEVAVVEAQPRILPSYDEELTKPVATALRKLGVQLYSGHSVLGLNAAGDALCVRNGAGETVEIAADQVLVAVGRKPRTDGWNLESLRLDMNGRALKIDEQCRTSMRNVWAIGDLAGEPMLAHRAMAQGEMVAELIAGKRRAFAPAAIPAVCFTDPEVVSVGLSPEQAQAAHPDCLVAQFPFAANGRAMTLESSDGFVRVLARRDNHLILGWQAVGKAVSELSTAFIQSIEMGARLEDIAGTIHAHPTLGEAVQEAALRALGHALHI